MFLNRTNSLLWNRALNTCPPTGDPSLIFNRASFCMWDAEELNYFTVFQTDHMQYYRKQLSKSLRLSEDLSAEYLRTQEILSRWCPSVSNEEFKMRTGKVWHCLLVYCGNTAEGHDSSSSLDFGNLNLSAGSANLINTTGCLGAWKCKQDSSCPCACLCNVYSVCSSNTETRTGAKVASLTIWSETNASKLWKEVVSFRPLN